MLWRNTEGKGMNVGVEKILQSNERLKMDKIGFFYYLIDF